MSDTWLLVTMFFLCFLKLVKHRNIIEKSVHEKAKSLFWSDFSYFSASGRLIWQLLTSNLDCAPRNPPKGLFLINKCPPEHLLGQNGNIGL